jgi:hypothetical protein
MHGESGFQGGRFFCPPVAGCRRCLTSVSGAS